MFSLLISHKSKINNDRRETTYQNQSRTNSIDHSWDSYLSQLNSKNSNPLVPPPHFESVLRLKLNLILISGDPQIYRVNPRNNWSKCESYQMVIKAALIESPIVSVKQRLRRKQTVVLCTKYKELLYLPTSSEYLPWATHLAQFNYIYCGTTSARNSSENFL